MGIFGNDRNDQDFAMSDDTGAVTNGGQVQQTYIDGVMAAQNGNSDSAMQHSVSELTAQEPVSGPQSAPGQDFFGGNQPPHDDQVQSQPPVADPVSVLVEGDDLTDIKQQALQHLSPLVGHLDQSPEEKFHTTMMMLQATDDQNLVKAAFDAAKDIPDDKARAQALMDVINEINYFTQNKQQS